MRIKVSQEELNSAVSIALRAISMRSILPILSGARLVVNEGKLNISATDLDITLHCSIAVNVEEEGRAVIPAKLLGEAVKSLPSSMVDLSVDNNDGQASISCENAHYVIKTMPLEDYPQLPESDMKGAIRLSGEVLSEAIRQVIKAVGRDEARPTLGGVLFTANGEKMKMVSTDSYRLAVKEINTEGGEGELELIIPGRAVEELGKLTGEDSISMNVGDGQVFYKAGETELISRLIEGQFPKYEQLLPNEWATRVRFDKEMMISAIKRISVISPTTAIVRVVIDGDVMKFNSYAQDIGSADDEVRCTTEGEKVEIAFNAQYLLDGLTAVRGSEAYIEMSSPIKPAVIKSTDKQDYIYLIMPIRLS
ncbi:MAG: DNA polymerase III subunit beta [Actinobacteria bacterium]|nr:DNA polymerase III subunit beta [Actinomycetota bacterium]